MIIQFKKSDSKVTGFQVIPVNLCCMKMDDTYDCIKITDQASMDLVKGEFAKPKTEQANLRYLNGSKTVVIV